MGVRAAVRPDSRGVPYAGGLTRVVTLDLLTGEGLDAAMEGVGGVYHLAPNVHPDEVAMARRVADSAAAHGVSRFVFHSVLHPDDASMPHHRRKAEAEVVVRERVVTATVLRPAAYAQNLLGAALAGRMEVHSDMPSQRRPRRRREVAAWASRRTARLSDVQLAEPELLSVR